MNRQPHRTSFSPAEAAVLLAVGLLILVTAGFVLYALLGVLNPRPAPAAQAQAGQAATASPTVPPVVQPVAIVTAALPPNPTLQPSPTSGQSTAPPPPPAACAPQNTEIRLGSVVEVRSGDTLLVNIDGVTIPVGYAGIESPGPEAGRAGMLALQTNRELLEGRPVVLVKDVSEYDAGGRLLRYVFFTGDDGVEHFANYALAALGFASTVDSPDQACAGVLAEAAQAARAGLLGMWAPTPVPTATFLPTVGLDPGSQAACNCGVRWECSDFRSRAAAQTCLNACNDYNSRLDDDRDGLACEHLP